MVTAGAHRGRIGRRINAWRWRLRYWWLDTESGAHAQVALFCVGVLAVVIELVRMTVAALHHVAPAPGEVQVQKAVIWWVVQLIIVLVSLILSYVLRPKIPKQNTPMPDGPSVEDGQAVDDHFGQVWVADEHILAFKVVRTEKIKSKTGKK